LPNERQFREQRGERCHAGYRLIFRQHLFHVEQ
jgi:hypothetical protein